MKKPTISIDKIKQIKNYHTRVKVARIIWWDILSQTGDKSLNRYVHAENDKPVHAEEIRLGLIHMGYTEEAAQKRTSHIKNKQAGVLRCTGYGNMKGKEYPIAKIIIR